MSDDYKWAMAFADERGKLIALLEDQVKALREENSLLHAQVRHLKADNRGLQAENERLGVNISAWSDNPGKIVWLDGPDGIEG